MITHLLSYIFLIGSSLATNTSQPHNSTETPYIACLNENQLTSNIQIGDHLNLSRFTQDDNLTPINIDGISPANITFHTPGNYLCRYNPGNQSVRYHRWVVSPKTTTKKDNDGNGMSFGLLMGGIEAPSGLFLLILGILGITYQEKNKRKIIDKIKLALEGSEYEHKYQKTYLYDPPARSFCGVLGEVLKSMCKFPKGNYIKAAFTSYKSFDPEKHDLKLTIPYPKDAQQAIIQAIGYDVLFPEQGGPLSREQTYYLRIKDYTPPKDNLQRTTPGNNSVTEALTGAPYTTPNLPQNRCYDCFCTWRIRDKKSHITFNKQWEKYLSVVKGRPTCILALPNNLTSKQKKKLHQALAFDETFYNQFIGAIDVVIQEEPEEEPEEKDTSEISLTATPV